MNIMNDEKRELLMNYIKSNVVPILVDFIDGSSIPDSVILPANCDVTELNGYYDNTKFDAPEWLKRLESDNTPTILVIDKIDSIPKDEQKKFVEILKYRKVSTFEIPKNTVIVVTAKEINENTINEEIYSLVAHIKG